MKAELRWNNLKPSQRLELISIIGRKTGFTFGASNADCKFEKTSNKLKNEIEKYYDALDAAKDDTIISNLKAFNDPITIKAFNESFDSASDSVTMSAV